MTEQCSKKTRHQAGRDDSGRKFSLSEVECLGSCGTAPMLQLNLDYHENLTTEKIDALLDECERDQYEFQVKVN